MNLKLDPKSAVLGAVLVLSGALAADELPGLIQHVFKAGDPIRAADVNANFANLGNAVNLLQGQSGKPITTDRLEDGSVTAQKLSSQASPADGQVLGYKSGQLVWGAATQGPKGDPGPQGPVGPQGPAGRDAESPSSKIYTRITERAARVVGNVNSGFLARCDSLFDKAIGGIIQYTGGENPQYLQMVSSYPAENRQDTWIIRAKNRYGDDANANSIIYVDIGVVCVKQ